MIRLIALAPLLCMACAAPPEPTSADARMLDMHTDATPRRPVGSACSVAADCQDVCLLDPALGGRRCVPACEDGACPAGLICRVADDVAGCVIGTTTVGEGEACGIDARCAAPLRCVADLDPAQTRCARVCAADDDCDAPDTCGPTGVCAPPDAPVQQCPFTPCAREDLLCVDMRCVATCLDLDRRCVDGGRCTRRPEDGAQLCQPDAAGGLGDGCVSGGAASCQADLVCLSRAPGDPAAVCSRSCADDCPADFACRRPTGFAAPHCLPVVFGVGAGDVDRFGACDAHGQTDCLDALDCIDGPGSTRVCARPCAQGCSDDAVCDDTGLTPHCRRRTRARIGLPCAEDDDCPQGRCVDAARPYCTAACEAGCPPGFVCFGDECLVGEVSALPVGEPCAEGGAPSCASGICAAHPTTGAAVCTQDCAQDPCPDGFDCQAIDMSLLCFRGTD